MGSLASVFEKLNLDRNGFDDGSSDASLQTERNYCFSAAKGIRSLVESLLDLSCSAKVIPHLPVERYIRVFPDDSLTDCDRRTSWHIGPEEKLLNGILVNAEALHTGGSTKNIWHVELALEESVEYQPGDSFGIFVENEMKTVCCLLNRLDVKETYYVRDSLASNTIKCFTLDEAFRMVFDIFCPPKKSLLRLFADFCNDELEKQRLLLLSSDVGRTAYRKLFLENRASLVDVLFAFPSCHPPVERILDCLPFLTPRFYSASSSPKIDGSNIHFVFSLVHFTTFAEMQLKRRGHTTGVLNDACERYEHQNIRAEFSLYHRPSVHFHPPESLKVPYIMICAGTGIAPFRGFIKQRKQQYEIEFGSMKENSHEISVGPVCLFFGCQRQGEFGAYLREIEEAMGILPDSELFVCYSREEYEEDKYVQDILKKERKRIINLITSHPSSCIFVCGDGAGMANGVQEALTDIFQDYHGNSREVTTEFLKELAKQGRYVKDIWYWG
eukprot:jgi/Galph1/4685/GphlegSOOS_G3368.1